ncbi:hypothetical protein CCYA_CCYA04G1195 [Cyanidiococcus yangmingshanensis]|nr:hypothetical protein CCYA_CCYA04G1195 [Cyanidiococcus yangmingshanensis]
MWFFSGQYLAQCIQKYGVSRVCESGVSSAVTEARQRSEDSFKTLARLAFQDELQNDKALRSDSRLLAAMRLLLLTDPAPLDLLPQLLQLTVGGFAPRAACVAHLLVRRCASVAAAEVSRDGDPGRELEEQILQQLPRIKEAIRIWSQQVDHRHQAREVAAVHSAVALAIATCTTEIVELVYAFLLRASCSILGVPCSELEQASAPISLDLMASSALVRVWETDEEVDLGRRAASDSGWSGTSRTQQGTLPSEGISSDLLVVSNSSRQQTSPVGRLALLEAVLLGWRELQTLRMERLSQKPYIVPVRFLELSWNAGSAAARCHGVALVLQYAQFCRRTGGEFALPSGVRGIVRRAMNNSILLERLAADPTTQVHLVKLLQTLHVIQQLNQTASKRSGARRISLAQMRMNMLSTTQELAKERTTLMNRRALAARVKAEMSREKAPSVEAKDTDEVEEFSETEILTYVRRLCDYSGGNRIILEMLAVLSRLLSWDKWMFLEANDPSWPFTNEAVLMAGGRHNAGAETENDTAPVSTSLLLDLDDLRLEDHDDETLDQRTDAASQEGLSAQSLQKARIDAPGMVCRPLADIAMRRALYALQSVECVRRLAALTLWLQVLRPIANATPAAMEWLCQRPVYEALRRRIELVMNADRSAAVRVAAATAFIYMFYMEDASQLSQLEQQPHRYSELAEQVQPFLLRCAPRDAVFFLREGAFGYAKVAPQLARLHIQFCEQLASKYAFSPLILSWLRNGWFLCMESPPAARDVHASLVRCLKSPQAWLALAAAVFSRRFGVDLVQTAARDRPDDDDQRRLFAVSMQMLLGALWEAALHSTLLDVRRECVLAFATASALADEPYLSAALETLPAAFKRPGLGISSAAKVAYDALMEIMDARAAAKLMASHRRQAELAPALRKCAARATTVVIALSGLSKPPPYFEPLSNLDGTESQTPRTRSSWSP